MSRNNLHTHTVFCDGADTPEELVQYAISQKCEYIGFSGHSFTDIPDSNPFCMSRENTEKYKAEINRLKKAYGDKIKIFLGVEQDYFSDEPTSDYDFVIGSVHYVEKDGVFISVDDTAEGFIRDTEKYYGGDYYAMAGDYYALVGDLYNKTKCDIVGHFDLITKFNEGNRLFDTANPRYTAAADKALESLVTEDVIFEINYGAVAKGYRTEPYPEKRIAEKIKAAGNKMLFTSDCHKKEMLLFGIPDLPYDGGLFCKRK